MDDIIYIPITDTSTLQRCDHHAVLSIAADTAQRIADACGSPARATHLSAIGEWRIYANRSRNDRSYIAVRPVESDEVDAGGALVDPGEWRDALPKAVAELLGTPRMDLSVCVVATWA